MSGVYFGMALFWISGYLIGRNHQRAITYKLLRRLARLNDHTIVAIVRQWAPRGPYGKGNPWPNP